MKINFEESTSFVKGSYTFYSSVSYVRPVNTTCSTANNESEPSTNPLAIEYGDSSNIKSALDIPIDPSTNGMNVGTNQSTKTTTQQLKVGDYLLLDLARIHSTDLILDLSTPSCEKFNFHNPHHNFYLAQIQLIWKCQSTGYVPISKLGTPIKYKRTNFVFSSIHQSPKFLPAAAHLHQQNHREHHMGDPVFNGTKKRGRPRKFQDPNEWTPKTQSYKYRMKSAVVGNSYPMTAYARKKLIASALSCNPMTKNGFVSLRFYMRPNQLAPLSCLTTNDFGKDELIQLGSNIVLPVEQVLHMVVKLSPYHDVNASAATEPRKDLGSNTIPRIDILKDQSRVCVLSYPVYLRAVADTIKNEDICQSIQYYSDLSITKSEDGSKLTEAYSRSKSILDRKSKVRLMFCKEVYDDANGDVPRHLGLKNYPGPVFRGRPKKEMASTTNHLITSTFNTNINQPLPNTSVQLETALNALGVKSPIHRPSSSCYKYTSPSLATLKSPIQTYVKLTKEGGNFHGKSINPKNTPFSLRSQMSSPSGYRPISNSHGHFIHNSDKNKSISEITNIFNYDAVPPVMDIGINDSSNTIKRWQDYGISESECNSNSPSDSTETSQAGRPPKKIYTRRSIKIIDDVIAGLPLAEVERRREQFLQNLRRYMLQRGTPLKRIPCLGLVPIDLYKFYELVKANGGYTQVLNKRIWKRLYNLLGGYMYNTSAATSTRKHYENLLLPYELHESFLEKQNKATSEYIAQASEDQSHPTMIDPVNMETSPSNTDAALMEEQWKFKKEFENVQMDINATVEDSKIEPSNYHDAIGVNKYINKDDPLTKNNNLQLINTNKEFLVNHLLLLPKNTLGQPKKRGRPRTSINGSKYIPKNKSIKHFINSKCDLNMLEAELKNDKISPYKRYLIKKRLKLNQEQQAQELLQANSQNLECLNLPLTTNIFTNSSTALNNINNKSITNDLGELDIHKTGTRNLAEETSGSCLDSSPTSSIVATTPGDIPSNIAQFITTSRTHFSGDLNNRKNYKHSGKEAISSIPTNVVAKRRGRPPGTKNKARGPFSKNLNLPKGSIPNLVINEDANQTNSTATNDNDFPLYNSLFDATIWENTFKQYPTPATAFSPFPAGPSAQSPSTKTASQPNDFAALPQAPPEFYDLVSKFMKFIAAAPLNGLTNHISAEGSKNKLCNDISHIFNAPELGQLDKSNYDGNLRDLDSNSIPSTSNTSSQPKLNGVCSYDIDKTDENSNEIINNEDSSFLQPDQLRIHKEPQSANLKGLKSFLQGSSNNPVKKELESSNRLANHGNEVFWSENESNRADHMCNTTHHGRDNATFNRFKELADQFDQELTFERYKQIMGQHYKNYFDYLKMVQSSQPNSELLYHQQNTN